MQKPIQPTKPVNFENQPEELQALYYEFYDQYVNDLREYNEFYYDNCDCPEFDEPQQEIGTFETETVESNESQEIQAQKAEVLNLIDRAQQLLDSIIEEGKRLKRVPSRYFGKNKTPKKIELEPVPMSNRTKTLMRDIRNAMSNAYGYKTPEQWQYLNILTSKAL